MRNQFREGFSYYSGLSANRVPSRSGQRSSLVVLSGVEGSASHAPWEVLYNSHDFSNSNRQPLIEAIDAVQPGGAASGLLYADWAAAEALPEELALPSQDADGDGMANLLEFYFDLRPLVAEPSPLTIQRDPGGDITLRFPVGQEREGIRLDVEGSETLEQWEPLEDADSVWNVESGETVDRAILSLPGGGAPFLRLRVSLEE
jgi:hypothetical protein